MPSNNKTARESVLSIQNDFTGETIDKDKKRSDASWSYSTLEHIKSRVDPKIKAEGLLIDWINDGITPIEYGDGEKSVLQKIIFRVSKSKEDYHDTSCYMDMFGGKPYASSGKADYGRIRKTSNGCSEIATCWTTGKRILYVSKFNLTIKEENNDKNSNNEEEREKFNFTKMTISEKVLDKMSNVSIKRLIELETEMIKINPLISGEDLNKIISESIQEQEDGDIDERVAYISEEKCLEKAKKKEGKNVNKKQQKKS